MSETEARQMHDWWRAANYLSVGQIYLLDNPLLREPLKFEHIKPRLLGHWRTTPGLNFIYAHLNSVIAEAQQMLNPFAITCILSIERLIDLRQFLSDGYAKQRRRKDYEQQNQQRRNQRGKIPVANLALQPKVGGITNNRQHND